MILSDILEKPESDNSTFFLEYWKSRGAGGRLPGRPDIDPVDFPEQLPGVFLLEVSCPTGPHRLRLSGTGLDAAVGEDRTGQFLSAVEDGARVSPATVLADYEECIRSGQPRCARGLIRWPGQAALGFERLILPLARDGRSVDMILGVMSFMKQDASRFRR